MAKATSKKKTPQVYSKTDLIEHVAEDTGSTKVDTQKIITSALNFIVDAASKGKEVRLLKFGTFGTRHFNARVGRNPRTGEEVKIPASENFAFRSHVKF